MEYWQVAAGSAGRDYTQSFLDYGMAFVGGEVQASAAFPPVPWTSWRNVSALSWSPGERRIKRKTGEQVKRIAYHEAGHAALLWMFGNAYDIEFIDMRGKWGVHAMVGWRGLNVASFIEREDRGDELTRRIAKLMAQRSVMFNLAGYAAENRIDREVNPSWFADLLDLGEWEFTDADDIVERNDIVVVVGTAKSLFGDTGRAWQFLHRMASWTDEALAHPSLWAVVDAVAERLQTVKTRISGSRVIPVMEKAWGTESALPFMEMGRIWRRRFGSEYRGR